MGPADTAMATLYQLSRSTLNPMTSTEDMLRDILIENDEFGMATPRRAARSSATQRGSFWCFLVHCERTRARLAELRKEQEEHWRNRPGMTIGTSTPERERRMEEWTKKANELAAKIAKLDDRLAACC